MLRIRNTTFRFEILIFAIAVMFVLLASSTVYAQNPLGIGSPEQVIRPQGPFASVLLWIQQSQKEFYKAMTMALKEIKNGETGALLLIGLSFSYGLLHAAGPGHGKAVISSYVLANEVVLKRGIVLSFVSSFLQGLSAIIVISALLFFLRGAGFKSADLTRNLEIASYLGITLLGFWMLYSKIFKAKRAHTHNHDHGHSHSHEAALNHSHEHKHEHTHDNAYDHAHQGSAEVCSSCGHSHAPDPNKLMGDGNKKFGWSDAYSAVLAVGLRPCSGALIVLTFAFLNGLYVAGIASVLAMSFGTGLMVA
ncbi:MAG: nickel/cobalt transporter, partial [Nitratireductor sp.]